MKVAHFPIKTGRIALWAHLVSMALNDFSTIYVSLSTNKSTFNNKTITKLVHLKEDMQISNGWLQPKCWLLKMGAVQPMNCNISRHTCDQCRWRYSMKFDPKKHIDLGKTSKFITDGCSQTLCCSIQQLCIVFLYKLAAAGC